MPSYHLGTIDGERTDVLGEGLTLLPYHKEKDSLAGTLCTIVIFK